jgi:hypothetical protein
MFNLQKNKFILPILCHSIVFDNRKIEGSPNTR